MTKLFFPSQGPRPSILAALALGLAPFAVLMSAPPGMAKPKDDRIRWIATTSLTTDWVLREQVAAPVPRPEEMPALPPPVMVYPELLQAMPSPVTGVLHAEVE